MNQETFNNIKTKFHNGYFKEIKPNLDKYEQERIKANKLFYYTILPIALLLTLGIFAIFITSSKKVIDITDFIGIIILPAIFCCAVYKWLEKNLENDIKKRFMPNVCKCFDNLNWQNCDYYNEKEFHANGLLDYYNRYSFDDMFIGCYKDVKFEIIEANFKRESGSGKNKRSHTVFDGIILKLEMPKDFESHTLIRPDGIFKMPIKNLKRTELEDVVFEKKYDVYTNNEVEARVTITTGFMERLNNIEKVFNAQKVYVCFIGTNAYFGLHTRKDMFKICSLRKPINSSEFFVKMFEEIIAIYRLIDHLKLIK